jgi:diketogulonate reductase-like aldo/keto reductase
MGLSNYTTKDLERVISHGSGNPYVMQISLLKNKEAMVRMSKRAEGDPRYYSHFRSHTEYGCSLWVQSTFRHLGRALPGSTIERVP